MGKDDEGFCFVRNSFLINNLAMGFKIGFKFYPDWGPPTRVAYNNSFGNKINYDGFNLLTIEFIESNLITGLLFLT